MQWPKPDSDFARQELGPEAYNYFFETFCQWLNLITASPFSGDYRIAPSIITRSEAELFGNASPRFALRAMLPNGSFVNLRRLNTLARQTNGWYSPSDWNSESGAKTKSGSLSLLFSYSKKCVADCIIVPSPEYHKEYVIATVDILKEYGERGEKKTETPSDGVPFVKHIPLAGGMCGQAVSFMVSVLLHQHARGIHGLSEISSIIHQKRTQSTNVFGLGEADLEDICGYLNSHHIQLYATNENTQLYLQHIEAPQDRPKADEWLSKHLFTSAVVAYSRARMPVAIVSSTENLRPVYSSMGFENDSSNEDRHAVLIVGVSKNHAERKILINDPAGFPSFPYNSINFLKYKHANLPQACASVCPKRFA